MSNRKKVKPITALSQLQTGAYVLFIKHDDWCPRLKGSQFACTCEPEEVLLPYRTTEQQNP